MSSGAHQGISPMKPYVPLYFVHHNLTVYWTRHFPRDPNLATNCVVQLCLTSIMSILTLAPHIYASSSARTYQAMYRSKLLRTRVSDISVGCGGGDGSRTDAAATVIANLGVFSAGPVSLGTKQADRLVDHRLGSSRDPSQNNPWRLYLVHVMQTPLSLIGAGQCCQNTHVELKGVILHLSLNALFSHYKMSVNF